MNICGYLKLPTTPSYHNKYQSLKRFGYALSFCDFTFAKLSLALVEAFLFFWKLS